MLRKGENAHHTITANRRHKPTHQSVQLTDNKENINSRSPFATGQPGEGSNVVSPTFQTNSLLSLKEDRFRQHNKGYREVSLNLKDLNQPAEMKTCPPKALVLEEEELVDERARLVQHYKNQKYWDKIEALFQQEGVDAFLAWEHSVDKHKTVKEQLKAAKKENISLQQQLRVKDEGIRELEQQINDAKNQTRVLTQRKSKDTEKLLQQKEKQCSDLTKQRDEQLEQLKHAKEQLKKLQEKYADEKELKKELEKQRTALKEEMEKKVVVLREELEKKSQKLNQMERQMRKDMQSRQKEHSIQVLSRSEDRKRRDQLYIECEKLKEEAVKVEEKHKKELNELSETHRKALQQRQRELRGLQARLADLQARSETETAVLARQNNDLKLEQRQYNDIITELQIKNSEIQTLLKNKQQQFQKTESHIVQLEAALSLQVREKEDKMEQIGKYQDIINDLEAKLRQKEFEQQRERQLQKTKHVNSNGSSPSMYNQGSPNVFSRKTANKIREIFWQVKKVYEESTEGPQRRRYREDDSEERDSLSAHQVQKYVNQIHTDISSVLNKYIFVHNENAILKQQLDNDQEHAQVQLKRLKHQLALKEQTLTSILAFVPEDMKDGVVDLLQMTETLAGSDFHQQQELEDYNDMRESLQSEGKEWRDNYQRMRFKFRKLQDDIRRLQEQNQELKRRTKGKEGRKVLVTDYDYREGVSRKDIKKKYHFDH